MGVFFRVSEDKHAAALDNGKLYDKAFNRVDPNDLDPNDVVYKMTPNEFAQIYRAAGDLRSKRGGLYFRVHADKTNRSVHAGALYDDDFKRVNISEIDLSATIILLPVTPDEFQIAQDFRG